MARSKLAELESLIGKPTTEQLLPILPLAKPDDGFILETSNGLWDVRETFTPEQILAAHALVHDVLPKEAIPVAEDWGGNFFCLMIDGTEAGKVFWWSHEGLTTSAVASSLGEFKNGLSERGA